MSNTVNSLVVVVPTAMASVVAYITNASPIEYGIVGIVLTMGLIPIVKWMMSRMDFSQRAEADLTASREKRADNQLAALTECVSELRTLNHNHREFSRIALEKLDHIHTKVVVFAEREEEGDGS